MNFLKLVLVVAPAFQFFLGRHVNLRLCDWLKGYFLDDPLWHDIGSPVSLQRYLQVLCSLLDLVQISLPLELLLLEVQCKARLKKWILIKMQVVLFLLIHSFRQFIGVWLPGQCWRYFRRCKVLHQGLFLGHLDHPVDRLYSILIALFDFVNNLLPFLEDLKLLQSLLVLLLRLGIFNLLEQGASDLLHPVLVSAFLFFLFLGQFSHQLNVLWRFGDVLQLRISLLCFTLHIILS